MTRAAALREDDVVAALRAIVERSSRRVLVGIGDDAAVWQPSRSHRSVITTDALLENVHFSRAWMSWREIGLRAMASNLSDVAAMGARSILATVALGVPPGASLDDLRELYAGLTACADDSGCSIVGGDIVASPMLSLSITVVGEVRPTRLTLRDGAKPGDVLACTGALGASRAGLAQLREEIALSRELRDEALRAYRTPSPRWREGLWLGASLNVHAMMDISDGLSTDLRRLCERSGVGAYVDNVPVAPSARAAAGALHVDPGEYALAGGEDFELLVAVAPRAFDHLGRRYRAQFGRALERIGKATAESALVARIDGHDKPIVAGGWDHFAR